VAPAHLWIVDRPIQPCDRGLRASPVPLVFRLCRPGICGLPRGCVLQLIRLHPSTNSRWRPGCPGTRVASSSALFSCAGDGWSSCLASRILWRSRRLSRRLPRCPALPASPLRASTGSPRHSHVPAFPAMALRVAPRFPSFQRCARTALRVAPLPRSGCCASRCFRRVAPVSAPPVVPAMECAGCPVCSDPSALPALKFAGCPAAPLFQPRLLRLPPGRPGFRFLWRCRGGVSSGCPESCFPQRCRFCVPRVAPWSCIGGWVDDESLAGSNFASSA